MQSVMIKRLTVDLLAWITLIKRDYNNKKLLTYRETDFSLVSVRSRVFFSNLRSTITTWPKQKKNTYLFTQVIDVATIVSWLNGGDEFKFKLSRKFEVQKLEVRKKNVLY